MKKSLFLLLVILVLLSNKTLGGSDWQYNSSIIITENSGNNLIDYPMVIELDTVTLIAEGKMQTDCGDIRIKENGIEKDYAVMGCNTSNTKIAFRIDIMANTTKYDVSLYYGYPTVMNGNSSWNAIRYNYFDDFNIDNFEENWNFSYSYGGNWTIDTAEGVLKQTDPDATGAKAWIKPGVWNTIMGNESNYYYETRMRSDNFGSIFYNNGIGILFRLKNYQWEYGSLIYELYEYDEFWDAADGVLYLRSPYRGWGMQFSIYPWHSWRSWTISVFENITNVYAPCDWCFRNESLSTVIDNKTLGLPANGSIGYIVNHMDLKVDWLKVRKYVQPEPSYVIKSDDLVLLEKYSPVLFLHPNEEFYPRVIESMLHTSDLKRWNKIFGVHQNTTTVDYSPLSREDLTDPSYNEDYFIDMINATGGISFLTQIPDPSRFTSYDYKIYGRVYRDDPNYIVLQYWFFYPYNPGVVNNHEGDWERIQVILAPEEQEPQVITYSHHECHHTHFWSNITKIDNTHPQVVVAKGGHASYKDEWTNHPECGIPGIGIGHGVEELSINGSVLYHKDMDVYSLLNNKSKYAIEDVSNLGPDSWIHFRGRWGQDQIISHISGPRGPGQKTDWQCPILWALITPILPSCIQQNLLTSTINQDESQLHTFTVDSSVSQSLFGIDWSGSNLDLTLIMPNGTIIDPYYVNESNITYVETNFSEYYEINNPEPGFWIMNITAVDVPPEGENYTAIVELKTNLQLLFFIDKDRYNPNEEIPVQARLYYNYTLYQGASIIAEIQKLDGIENITLFDDGLHNDNESNDGIYGNIYTNTSIEGEYIIKVKATGLNPFNETFVRETSKKILVKNLPDLVPIDLVFSNEEPIAGEIINITATILNNGTKDANDILIQFYNLVDVTEQINSNITINLSVNERKNISVIWNTTYGNYTIFVVVDPLNKILEENEINNIANKNIGVKKKCVEPTNSMVITEDTLFCSGKYNLSNGIIIGADNIILDCNNSILNGNQTNNGIYLSNKFGVTIKNCNVQNYEYGINLYSKNSTILNNNVSSNYYGIYLSYSSDNIISDNNVLDNKYAIYFHHSPNNTISNNNILYNNADGVLLYYSSDNTMSNNIASNNGGGIYLSASSKNNLTGNILNSNGHGLGVNGVSFQDFINNIDTTNKVDGKPVYYWINEKDKQIPNDAGYVGIINSTNITIKNITLAKNSQGILLAYTTDSHIENTIIENTHYGIELFASLNNKILYNDISLNNFGIRIRSSLSSNNTILDNSIAGNGVGIRLNDGSKNIISNNYILNNKFILDGGGGIWLIRSSNNTIFNNYISNNWYGIYTDYSSIDNKIEYNNIIDNINYSFYNLQSENITVEYNYWGTINCTAIDNKIYDDEEGKGRVDFEPFLDLPYPDGTAIYCKIKFNISLLKGWNLISSPLELANNSVNYLFDNTSIYGYKNNSFFVPKEIDTKLGYWVKLNESINLTLIGFEIEDKTINLKNGWNLVGYPSLNALNINKSNLKNYTIFTYINNSWSSYIPNRPFNSLQTLKPGYGYWVKVEASSTETTCYNCSDCTAKLNGNYTLVLLDADIFNHSGTCIHNPANFNNKIFDCQGYTIDGDDSINRYGIYLRNKHNNTIRNCVIKDFYRAIYLSLSAGNTLANNKANSNNNCGICLENSSNTVLTKNNANLNNWIGIALSFSSNNTLTDNIANLNIEHGISLENSSNNTLTKNIANSNFYGIFLSSSYNSKINNNTANNNQFGISFEYGSTNNNLTENFICSNGLDVKDDDVNSGDENTCDTVHNWDDDETVGCTYPCP